MRDGYSLLLEILASMWLIIWLREMPTVDMHSIFFWDCSGEQTLGRIALAAHELFSPKLQGSPLLSANCYKVEKATDEQIHWVSTRPKGFV